jgi:hypothetical protein
VGAQNHTSVGRSEGAMEARLTVAPEERSVTSTAGMSMAAVDGGEAAGGEAAVVVAVGGSACGGLVPGVAPPQDASTHGVMQSAASLRSRRVATMSGYRPPVGAKVTQVRPDSLRR